MRVAEAIELDEKTACELLTLSKGRRVEARVQQRANVILLAAQGWQNKNIASEVRLDRRQVALWRRRFIEGGVQALLLDASRSGRTPIVTPEMESHIVRTTLYEQPAKASHWSTRSLASHLGLSATTIRRVWQRNGISPQSQVAAVTLPAPFPRSAGELVDVVGLYINPRERMLVIGHTMLGPARLPGRPSSVVNDLEIGVARQNDMAELCTAIGKLDSAVVSMCEDRHHHEDWFRFLRLVDRMVPTNTQLRLIVENQATHKRPKVQAWLAAHPRFGVHSIPGGGQWLNAVGLFLDEAAGKNIRGESFARIADLQRAIAQSLDHFHKNPRPFRWLAGATDRAQATRKKAAMARWGISAEQSGASGT